MALRWVFTGQAAQSDGHPAVGLHNLYSLDLLQPGAGQRRASAEDCAVAAIKEATDPQVCMAAACVDGNARGRVALILLKV